MKMTWTSSTEEYIINYRQYSHAIAYVIVKRIRDLFEWEWKECQDTLIKKKKSTE